MNSNCCVSTKPRLYRLEYKRNGKWCCFGDYKYFNDAQKDELLLMHMSGVTQTNIETVY